MTVLEAINQMLAEGAGLPGVNTADEGPDALRASQMLERVRIEVLSHGYLFNLDTIDLNRDVNGIIAIPETYLAVLLPAPYTIRDRKVFNPETLTYDVAKDFSQTQVAKDIPFEQTPLKAALYISWEATRRFCASIRTAASPQYGYCVGEARRASVAMNIEYPVTVQPKYGALHGRRGLSQELVGKYGLDTWRWCVCV